MDSRDGLGGWTLKLGSGNGLWEWTLGMDSGDGFWGWTLGMDSGNGVGEQIRKPQRGKRWKKGRPMDE